jgi:hypothetical protein
MRYRSGLTLTILFALAAWSPSCQRAERKGFGSAVQRTFATPDDAGSALAAAARSGDDAELTAIFGAGSRQVVFTGDPAADKNRLQEFANAYQQMHRWSAIKGGGEVLHVGAGNYPFPVPLGQNSSGRWVFDTGAGKDEILARRIGTNELTAMDATSAIANAEHQYWNTVANGGRRNQYAQQLVSNPGQENGLYWTPSPGQPQSPLGSMGDFTKALASATPGKPVKFNGYYYRIFFKNGGFTALAYPEEYRNSGIMTFMVGEDGALYQKDLGEKTAETVASMIAVDPRDGWNSTGAHAGSASRVQQ